MNILLLTQYFWPEIGAPQVIHSEWIRRLTRRGHRVQVVTSFPNYPDGVIRAGYQRRLFMREEHAGADVYRTATYAARNAGFARRLMNHLSLTASSWSAFPFVGPIDVVITEYPPLFTALSGIAFSRLRGIPHILNAGDLWVEVALELGILQQGPLASAALAASTAVEKASARVLVTSKGCIQKLASVGVDPAKVVYLPNSVDTDAFQPDEQRRRRVRAEWKWEDEVVCLYHGTHGLAQGLLQVVEAAHLLRDDPKLRFVLIGSGAEKDLVVRRVAELKLQNVELHPPQPFSSMPGIIDASDIGLVPLKAIPMFGITLPSKMFEFMSMQKPVALAVDGDAREIVEGGGAGVFAPPEGPQAYAAAIRRLAGDRAAREAMGGRGRELAVERYSRDRFANDLEQTLLAAIRSS
ncbi:MAG TPA: glycosyltransferase family 4 protein [Polyangiaceae bacterium]|nr:glycosyltransferase family 4 protein [Polyangiaceae bacterium]